MFSRITTSRSKWMRCAIVVAVLVLMLWTSSEALACPTCKEGLNDPASQAMAAGYFYSILFMMSMPFLILGTFGSFAYRSIRKADEARVGRREARVGRREARVKRKTS